MTRVLVFGYGNPSRGDDALGPRLVTGLETRFEANPEFKFLTDFQLQIEHALDLADCSLVLFADAHVSCEPPFEFQRLAAARDDSYTTHAMSPAAVIQVYSRLHRQDPPPTFLLTIRGHRFELGESLSAAASDNLAAALVFCRILLESPSLTAWESIASSGADGLQPQSGRPSVMTVRG